jgi:glutathione S-transferase
MIQLVGLLDSPYVRRVAISLKLLDIPFERRALSVFRNFDEFSAISGLVKAPTLICDDGTVLVDSNMILEHLERISRPERRLMPANAAEHRRAVQLVGLALAACEKGAQSLYERMLRPPEKQHQPWLDRVNLQLAAALRELEQAAEQAHPWMVADRLTQADITTAVAWRFGQHAIPM